MQLLALSDVAAILKRGKRNTTEWLREKNIPFVPIGKSKRWQDTDIIEALEHDKIRPNASSHVPKRRVRNSPISGKSNEDVLQSMGY